MAGDDRPPLRRVKRAKATTDANGIDGGAVAVGLLLSLAAFAPSVALSPPVWIGVLGVGGGLVVGGFFAGRLAAGTRWCPMCHGALVGVATVAVVGTVALVDHLASGEPVRLGIVDAADPATLVALCVAGVLLPAVTGRIGAI